MQLLEFPHARVDGHYFYHTVQRDDKLQYVREPIEGMKITEETLKTKILQLQDKYGDEARDRQGKKLYRISDIVAREGKDRQDFFERRSLQQLLKDPDKIIKEYLRFSIGEARREKMIKLMCGLEAANTAQEAGLACIDGLHDSLFDLHGQRAKGPFLSTMDIRNTELLEPHRNKENDFLNFEDDLLDEDISQEEQQQPSVSTQKIEPAQEQQQPTTETPQAEQVQEEQQPTTETPKAGQAQDNIEEDTLDLREALTDKSQTDQDKLEITDDLPEVEQLKYDIPERDQDTASKGNEETVDFDAGKAFEESEEKPRYNLYKDRVEYDADAREYKRKEPILISERGRGEFRKTSENAKSVAGRKHQNRSSRSRNGKARDNDFGEII